jgi:hypothetical protein
MPKNKYIFSIFLTGILSCSCLTQEDNIISVNLSTKKHIISTISDVIFLETNNDFLIDRNYTFYVTSQYYIFGDRKKILIFSKQGKAKSIIQAIGNGPNEVPNIDFFYANDKSVMIMAIGKKQLVEFDFEGKFIQAHPIQDNHFLFACFKDYYLFDNQSKATEKGNVLSIFDKVGKIVNDSIPVIAEGIGYGKDKFQTLEEYSLYLPTMSNIIYKINKSASILPAYRLDFGSHWLDSKKCDEIVANSGGDAFALWKYLKKNDLIGFLRFRDTQEWLFLNFEKQDKNYNWYYNKISKNQYLTEVDNNNGKKSAPSYDIIGVDNNKFLAIVSSDVYLKMENMPQFTLVEEDNPVIIIFEMADEKK